MTSVLDRSPSKKPLAARVKVNSTIYRADGAAGETRGNGEARAVLRQGLQRAAEELELNQEVLTQAASEVSSLLPEIKNLPTPVSSWEVTVGFNYDGDPSIYIVATAEDDNIKDEEVKCNKRIDSFSVIYELVAEKINPSIFVYVDLRAASEL